MRRILVFLLMIGIPLHGCGEDPKQAAAKTASQKPIHISANCDETTIFTNNTTQYFVITKIIRGNKAIGATLKIENEKIWEYRGYGNSKSIHKLTKGLFVEPKAAVICDHDDNLITIFGHFTNVAPK